MNEVPYRRASRPVTLEGRLVDEEGRPLPQTQGWRQHPQQIRPRRLQPYGRPDEIDQLAEQDAVYGYGPQGMQPAPSVVVNTGGQFYRPWKEELYISGWKTAGNLLAWPFRLVGEFVKSIVMMFSGVLKIILMAVVMPMLLFSGYSFYSSHKDMPATEIAAELGKSGVHLVGAAIGGIWDGIFGDEEPVKAAKGAAKDPDAAPAKAKDRAGR